jgi:hypothetical protein
MMCNPTNDGYAKGLTLWSRLPHQDQPSLTSRVTRDGPCVARAGPSDEKLKLRNHRVEEISEVESAKEIVAEHKIAVRDGIQERLGGDDRL